MKYMFLWWEKMISHKLNLQRVYQMSKTEHLENILSNRTSIWIIAHLFGIILAIFFYYFTMNEIGYLEFILNVYFIYVIITSVLLFNFNTISFAGEIEKRTLETKITLPYSRSEIFLGKVTSQVYLIFIGIFIFAINIVVVSSYFGTIPNRYIINVMELIFIYLIYSIAIIAVSSAISISIKQSLPSIMIMICYFIGMFFSAMFDPETNTIRNAEYYPNYSGVIVFPYYGIIKVTESLTINGEIDLIIILLFIIYSAILLMISNYLFKELDL